MFAYYLSSHARACVSEEGAVLLDLRRGTYAGIDADKSRALRGLVQGWPLANEARGAEDSKFAQELCLQGWLTSVQEDCTDSLPDADVQVQSLSEPRCELVSWPDMSCRVRIEHVLTFLWAALTVLLLLRLRSLEQIVLRIGRRRQSTSSAFDVDRARELVSAYHYLRILLFARLRRCLFDSLVMLEFLSHYEVYPLWVIGVRYRPFAAHSWLQYEHFILNGTPGFVRSFQLILVV